MLFRSDLVRQLLWDSWFRLTASCSEATLHPGQGELNSAASDRARFRQSEVERLAAVAEAWLDTPGHAPGGRTPRSIIERERMRLPEVEQDHHAGLEPDCPICEMMRLSPGPIFWCLDGSHFDDDFAFDHHCESPEEWREKQIDWQRFISRVQRED